MHMLVSLFAQYASPTVAPTTPAHLLCAAPRAVLVALRACKLAGADMLGVGGSDDKRVCERCVEGQAVNGGKLALLVTLRYTRVIDLWHNAARATGIEPGNRG